MSLSLGIIIPCYNHHDELLYALSSIDDLVDHPEIVVVVDDGSTPPVQLDERDYHFSLKVIRHSNKGLTESRNRGLSLVDTQWVYFLDADDSVYPNAFGFLRGLTTSDITDVYCMAYDIQENGTLSSVYPRYGKPVDALLQCNLGPPHSYLYRTNAVKELGGFDTQKLARGGHEDYDLVCRLAAAGGIFSYRFEKAGIYNKRPGSMSTNQADMVRTRAHTWCNFFLSLDISEITFIGAGNALAFFSRHYNDLTKNEARSLNSIIEKLSRTIRSRLISSEQVKLYTAYLPPAHARVLVNAAVSDIRDSGQHVDSFKSFDWRSHGIDHATNIARLNAGLKCISENNVRAVYVWGATDLGRLALNTLNGASRVRLIDTHVRDVSWYDGVIDHPKDITDLNSTLFFIASNNNFDEIKRSALSLGVRESWIF